MSLFESGRMRFASDGSPRSGEHAVRRSTEMSSQSVSELADLLGPAVDRSFHPASSGGTLDKHSIQEILEAIAQGDIKQRMNARWIRTIVEANLAFEVSQIPDESRKREALEEL